MKKFGIIFLFIILCLPFTVNAKMSATFTCEKEVYNETTKELQKVCYVTAVSEDQSPIEYLNGSLALTNLTLKSAEALNNWQMTQNGMNFQFKNPSVLINNSVAIAKFTFVVDIKAEECKVVFRADSMGANKHSCEIIGNIYYDKAGNIVSESEYHKSCDEPKPEPPKCEIKDGKYYDKNGNEVSESDYHKSCDEPKPETPKCEIKDGKYYDKNGNEVSESEYHKSCDEPKPEPLKCEIKDGKYYDKNGNEVSESEYHKSCDEPKPEPPKCEIKDGKYYDKNGNEVSESEYHKSCDEPKPETPKCSENGGKYYDKNGNSVTKDEYLSSCGLVENPKTGSTLSLVLFVMGSLLSYGIYKLTKKQKIYKL